MVVGDGGGAHKYIYGAEWESGSYRYEGKLKSVCSTAVEVKISLGPMLFSIYI